MGGLGFKVFKPITNRAKEQALEEGPLVETKVPKFWQDGLEWQVVVGGVGCDRGGMKTKGVLARMEGNGGGDRLVMKQINGCVIRVNDEVLAMPINNLDHCGRIVDLPQVEIDVVAGMRVEVLSVGYNGEPINKGRAVLDFELEFAGVGSGK